MTNDIKGITAGSARFAGLCTAKGRLLALFLIWRDGEDFLLMLPRDILPAILKKLSMYVLRAKVKLSDASQEFALVGLSATDAVAPAPTLIAACGDLPRFGATGIPGGRAIRLDDHRWLLALDPGLAATTWQDIKASARPVGLAAWNWLESPPASRASSPRRRKPSCRKKRDLSHRVLKKTFTSMPLALRWAMGSM